MHQEILISLTSILILGIGAQWLAWRLRLPSILMLLIFGFVAGPVTGLLDPDHLLGETLFPLVSVAVGIILFEGGLSLKLDELRGVGGVIRRLISLGALVTWIIGAAAAYYLLGLELALATLLGAILVVSGPTVVIPLLRFIRPTGRVSSILKWEGIMIDPVGATLAVLVFEEINAGIFEQLTLWGLLGGIVITLLIGGLLGALAAGLLVQLFQRQWVPEYLQTAVTLMAVLTAFAASNTLQAESGLMAATIMGIVLANQKRVNVGHIVSFKEELGVLLLSVLFILLAARLQLADVTAVGVDGLVFLLILILIARPLSVLLSTVRSDLPWRERLFLAWLAPRGIVAAAVASLFALDLSQQGYPGAERLVSITFLVVVGTVAVYALSTGWLARRLGLVQVNPQGTLIIGAHHWAQAIAATLQSAGFTVVLLDTNRSHVREARLAGLEAVHGSALTDDIVDELPLGQIGRVLALTSNSELNALASLRFAQILGADHVFQLASTPAGTSEHVAQGLRGRLLFGPDLTYDNLDERFAGGAILRQTRLTDVFTYETFRAHHGETAMPLFIVEENGDLQVITADGAPLPRPGQTLISLTTSKPTEAPAAAIDDSITDPVPLPDRGR